MAETQVGERFTKTSIVTKDMLAASVGSGSVAVAATPIVIALMEGAAAALVQPGLAEGITTVGTKIAIEHMYPTPEGGELRAEAELTAVEGRKYTFKIEAYDNAGLVASGTHERFSVKQQSFEAKAKERIYS